MSYLKEIYESDQNNNAFNSTAFRYGDTPALFSSSSTNVMQGIEGRFQLGDYNADGYSDILYVKTALQDNKTRDIEFKTFLRVPGDTDNFTLGTTESLPLTSSVYEKKDYPNSNSLSGIDYNGDGYNDILVNQYEILTGSGGQPYTALKTINVYENQKDGSFLRNPISLPPYKEIVAHGSIYGGDFNGDGIQDILMATYNASVRLSRISTSFMSISALIPGQLNLGYADKVIIFDFNSDGKSDIMAISNNECEVMTLEGDKLRRLYYSNNYLSKDDIIYLGDFNGDGKTDILSRKSKTNNAIPWKIRYATGTDYTSEIVFTFQVVPNITGVYRDDHLSLADFNGDGRTDIYHAIKSISRLDLYFTKSNNQFDIQNINASVGYTPTSPGDINGDGVADIIDRNSYTSPAPIFYFNKNRRDHLLQKVKNGIGHTTEWEYKRLNEEADATGAFYRRLNPNRPYPINSILVPMRAVSAFKVTDGVGGSATKTFTYKDALLHIGGKGLLGFEKTTTTDDRADVSVVTENEVNTSKYLLLPKSTKTYKLSTSTLLSESNSSMQVVDLGGTRYRVQANSSSQINYFENKSSVTNNNYDGNGMVIYSNTKLYGGNMQTLVEESSSSTQYGQYGGRIPNRATNVTVSKTRGGYTSSEVKTMEYDGYGQLTAKVDFAGQSQSVRTEYTYSALGNITKTKLRPTGMTDRETNASYDTKGRFVTSSSNILGQTSSSSYDNFGQVLSTTGIDGLTTSFLYDGFGRLTQTTLPTGVQINQSKGWNYSYGAVYYNSVQHPGKPDQTTYYDILGREIRTETEGYGGKTIITDQTYTNKGQVATSSQKHYRPDQGGEAYLTTTNAYDSYNRLTSSSNSLGTISVSYAYASDGKMTVTTTDMGGRNSSKVMDAAGKTIQSTDNGGTQNYVYNAQDKLMSVTNTDGTVLNTSVYDQYGRQTQLNDLSAGTTNYAYDALGQLTSETNAKGQTHNMSYDILGRITIRTGPEGNTSTEYYGSEGGKTNQIKKITGFSGETTEYFYDSFGRLNNTKETIDGIAFNSSMSYNSCYARAPFFKIVSSLNAAFSA